MSLLAVTFIDVGWGDCILLESTRDDQTWYALVDCNDTTYFRSGQLFLKRFFERRRYNFERPIHTFEFVLLTHNHADHAKGLSRAIRAFGAKRFLYSNSNAHPLLAQILRYARRRNNRLRHAQPVDNTTDLSAIDFGDVALEILWPPPGQVEWDENDNSVVLSLTLGDVSFVLTGDATAMVWDRIVPALPPNMRVFQVPHHGARNGTFHELTQVTPWLDHIRQQGNIAVCMSSHTRPFEHPNQDVIDALRAPPVPVPHLRTDRHYHIRCETDGTGVRVMRFH
jgi:beta-lactamase superfamily II metal-dependent hydrolase